MKKYKITNQDMTTYADCKWEIGVKKEIAIPGNTLCSDQVFHFYDSPEIAVLLNPIFYNYKNYRMWEIDGDEVSHDGLKGGSKWQTLVREVRVPIIALEKKIQIAILLTHKIAKCTIPEWNKWADAYLSGDDRSAAWTERKWAKSAARAALAALAAWAEREWAESAARTVWTAWTESAESAATIRIILKEIVDIIKGGIK